MTLSSAKTTPRPRKTPLQARSRATIETVLSAAAHIISRGGMSAFNTNAVAERAGVSIGSLYQYFPNKDAILVALIERRIYAFTEAMESLVGEMKGGSFAEDLRRFLSEAGAGRNEEIRLTRVLDAEEERLAPALDLQHIKGRMDATLIQIAERHKEEFVGFDIPHSVSHIAAICRAILQVEDRAPDPDWRLAVERTVAAVTGYLSVPPRSAKMNRATDLGE